MRARKYCFFLPTFFDFRLTRHSNVILKGSETPRTRILRLHKHPPSLEAYRIRVVHRFVCARHRLCDDPLQCNRSHPTFLLSPTMSGSTTCSAL